MSTTTEPALAAKIYAVRELMTEQVWSCAEGDSLDTAAQQRLWAAIILPSTFCRAIRGRYRMGKKTWRYAAAMFRAAFHQEYARCSLQEFPAHLHINVDKSARGYGIGRQLMTITHEWITAQGVKEVELFVWEGNPNAIRFYEKLGYQTVRREMKLDLD